METDKLYQAFLRAGETGDSQAQQYFAEQIMRAAGKNPKPDKFADVNRRARVGRGMMDVGQGAKQRFKNITGAEDAPDYNRQVDTELRQYDRDVGKGFDGYRMLGQAAALSPVGLPAQKANALSRAAQGAWQGALAGGSLATKDNQSALTNSLVGGLGGSVVNTAAPVAGAGAVKGFDWLKNKALTPFAGRTAARETAPLMSQFADISPEIQANLKAAAQEQLRTTGKIDHDALLRMARYDQYGFKGESAPLSGQITRDPHQWARERNLSKLDGPGPLLTSRFENQNERFRNILDDLERNTGRNLEDVVDAGQSIQVAVRNRYEATQDAIRKLYGEAKMAHGNRDGITFGSLRSTLDELSDNATADAISDSVQRRLLRYGLADEMGQPTGKTLTVSQAEDFRKFIGRLSDNNDPTLQMYKRQLIEKVDDDVFNTIGDDAFSQARAAARSRFTEFEKKIQERIIGGKLEDDDVIRRVVYNHGAKNLDDLRGTLLAAEGGQEAWDNLRGQVIANIRNKAFQSTDKGEAFNSNAIRNELNKLGRKKIEILFPDDADYLFGLSQVASDLSRTPSYAAVNFSNTAATGANLLGMSGVEGALMRRLSSIATENQAVNRALTGYPVDRYTHRQNLGQWAQQIGNMPPIDQIRRQSGVVGGAATTGLLTGN